MKCRGILLGLLLIPVLFYTYKGVIGKSPDWINIAIFFIAAGIAYTYENRQFPKEATLCPGGRWQKYPENRTAFLQQYRD